MGNKLFLNTLSHVNLPSVHLEMRDEKLLAIAIEALDLGDSKVIEAMDLIHQSDLHKYIMDLVGHCATNT